MKIPYNSILASTLVLLGTVAAACQGDGATSSVAAPTEPAVGPAAVVMSEAVPVVHGGPAAGKRVAALTPVAVFPGPAQPVGVAVSRTGRTFVSFPRWLDPVQDGVVELVDGRLEAFPDRAIHAFDPARPAAHDPADHLVSVQALVFDERDRLWMLDTGAINFAPHLDRAPKLWAYDLTKRERVKAIAFPNDVALKATSLNDVRFDLRRGAEGTAYVTDSGAGGIIVVDLATGVSWRHLDGDPSVLPVPGLQQTSEGEAFLARKASGEIDAPDFRSDGIALSPDGKTLYYTPVTSRSIYAVPTDLLAQRDADERAIAAAVRVVASKPSGNDGILADAQGRIYTTDFEDNAIRRVDPATGIAEVVVQDERLIWPDTLALRGGGLYVTANQLSRQPNYHLGKDGREPPYTLFRFAVDGAKGTGQGPDQGAPSQGPVKAP